MDLVFTNLLPGDPAPWFEAASISNPRYQFHTVAGRYIVLCFFGSGAAAGGAAALALVAKHRQLFDDTRVSFFGVTFDPADRQENRLRESVPGIRHFLDLDGTISRLYGALPLGVPIGAEIPLRAQWVIIDPRLRVLKVFPLLANDPPGQEALFTYLSSLPPPELLNGFPLQAPILFLPDVFEPQLCADLVGLYQADGGKESGFMREIAGRTVGVSDPAHKRRRDYHLADPAMIQLVQERVRRRIVPEIAKAHQFQATRMERYLIGCYTAEDGGHFRAHRDNTTKGTAHRRFAVSINLNDAFDGGLVSFPEYGPQGYKPPPGGAVVFSCSLLHAVSRVTSGRRYAFLPFVYDEAAAVIRSQNQRFLATEG